MHCAAAAAPSAVPEREPRWLHRHTSSGGEATRCRRARTSCQRRTCGHLRFVIGQCAAGRSPTCKPRMREGASWPLAAEGGRGLPTCRLAQGLPAEEIVWGRAAAGTYPFAFFYSIVRSVGGRTHCGNSALCVSQWPEFDKVVPWICRDSDIESNVTVNLFCKPFVYEKDQSPAGKVGHKPTTGHRLAHGAWLQLKLAHG